MINLSEKRTHFRFPVYDDETGVKLQKKRNREFLKDILDDGFTYKKIDDGNRSEKKKSFNKNIDPVDMIDAPDYFGHDGLIETEQIKAAPKNQKSAFHEKKIKLDQKIVPVKNSNYVVPEQKEYSSPQSTFSNQYLETDNYGNAKHQKQDKRRSKFESSYDLPGEKAKNIFQPKHIPASIIEDEPHLDRPKHGRELLVDELRKASSNNLLLMEENAVLDPILDEVSPIDIETVETNSTNNIVEKKKNQRLEKTLSGIIEEEGSTKLDSYYFD